MLSVRSRLKGNPLLSHNAQCSDEMRKMVNTTEESLLLVCTVFFQKSSLLYSCFSVLYHYHCHHNDNVKVWSLVLLVSCVILNIAAVLLLLRCIIIIVIITLDQPLKQIVDTQKLIDRNVTCRITQAAHTYIGLRTGQIYEKDDSLTFS